MDSVRGDCGTAHLKGVTLDGVIMFEFIPMRCKPNKPTLRERPLLTPSQASGLMAVFKILANDTRLRLLHALGKSGELCVTDLAAAVDMKPQAVSNQLQKLVDRSILGCRRDGRRIRYRIVDQCVIALLDQGLCLTDRTCQRAAERSRISVRTPAVRLRRGGHNMEKAGSASMSWFICLVLALTTQAKGTGFACCDERDTCPDCQ